MNRLTIACWALGALGLSASATAAEITKIPSSFEENKPFGMFIDIGYVHGIDFAKISRENHQEGDLVDITELNYQGVEDRITLDLRIGLYKDLELHIGAPYVITAKRSWNYSSGTDASNSTITNNCLRPDGTLLDVNCPKATPGPGAEPLFPVKGESYRGDLGNVTFGLAYGIFTQARDDTKPDWIVGLDYEAPTAVALNPATATSVSGKGKIGDKFHHYTFFTSLSRKFGAIDPYFKVQYTLPIAGPNFYSNCSSGDPNKLSRPQNCGAGWSASETGTRVPHQAGVIFGSEFNAYDDIDARQKFAFDLRMVATYFTEGRWNNELSDAMGKMLYTTDYAEIGGGPGIVWHLSEYFRIDGGATYVYVTDHFLTAETVGKDINGNGSVDVTSDPGELNPTYDFRVDTVGRRFRLSDASRLRLSAMITLAF